jgi:hypothetical protein
MMRVLLYILPIALHIFVLFDIAQAKNVSLMPKWAWFLVQIVPIIGPILWFFSGRSRPKKKRDQGPDDDLDFLLGL